MKKVSTIILRHWKKIIVITIVLSLLSVVLTSFLFENLKVSWLDMVPSNTLEVKEFQKIIDNFDSATALTITVEGKNREQVVKAIDKIGKDLQSRKKMFRSVLYKNDPLYQNKEGLLLTKTKDLRTILQYSVNYDLVPFIQGLNDNFEAEYVGNSKSLKSDEKVISQYLNSLFDFFKVLKNYAEGKLNKNLLLYSAKLLSTGPEYFLSTDKKMGMITTLPKISTDNIDATVVMVNDLDKILRAWEKKLPGIILGQTGMHTITRDEMKTSQEDSMFTTQLAFLLILAFLIYAFKMWSAPLMGMITLIVGILLDFSLTYVLIGSLNMMTIMVGAILMGLGIDYGIHIIAQFSELQNDGLSYGEAIKYTFINSGRGILIGGLTTAAAFLIMAFIPFKAISELGVVAGVGILTTMLTTFFLLPAMMILREKRKIKKAEKKGKKIKQSAKSLRFERLATMERKVNSFPIITIMVVVLITIIMFSFATNLTFSGDLKDIEAKGLKSLELKDKIEDKMDMTTDSVLIISDSVAEDRRFHKILDKNVMISFVDSISSYLPSRLEQGKRKSVISEIRRKVLSFRSSNVVNVKLLQKEIDRFRMNILEIRDLARISGLDRVVKKCSLFVGDWKKKGAKKNSFINRTMRIVRAGKNRGSLLKMQQLFSSEMVKQMTPLLTPYELTLDNLPQSIKERVISKDGKKFLLSAYLKSDIWAGLKDSVFINNVKKMTKGRATGMAFFMKTLVDLTVSEGGRATMFALLIIFALLLLDFKNFRASIFIFVNLIISAIWMLGLAALLGEKINFMNVLALPLIIGIGIDDSVHIMHRYRQEGIEKLSLVLSSTGRAILLTTLTTGIGFGSLIFAKFQGFQSFGLLLLLGIVVAFFMSVLFLPALIRVFPNIFRNHKGDINEKN